MSITAEFAPEELLALFTDPSTRDDPYPMYHRLRQADPVHQSLLGAWVLTRHRDVLAVLRSGAMSPDQERSNLLTSATRRIAGPFDRVARLFTLFMDPPDHTRLRRLVVRAFTPSVVERRRARFRSYVDGVLGEAAERGSMDIVQDLALPMSTTFVCEVIGVPPADREHIHAWSRGLAARFDLGPLRSPVSEQRADQAAIAFDGYFRSLAARRRAEPADDLFSALLAVEEDGDRLTLDELVATCVLLVWAGHETTTSLMGNGTLALLQNPDALAALRADPTLVPGAVEELLRYDAPIQLTVRIATEPVTVDDRVIPAGSVLVLMLGAANRDPERFPDPDRLDVHRDAEGHVALGHGAHYCLGAALGRAEVQTALCALLDRFPGLRLDESRPCERNETLVLRGLKHLYVTW